MPAMSYCQTCGGRVGVEANFCPNCGTSQKPVENPVRAEPTGEPLLELHTHWFMTGRPVRIAVYESGWSLRAATRFARKASA